MALNRCADADLRGRLKNNKKQKHQIKMFKCAVVRCSLSISITVADGQAESQQCLSSVWKHNFRAGL